MAEFRHKIVVTGAPGSGKSEFIGRLKKSPVFRGFQFFEELARSLLESDPSYRERWDKFHLEIYRRQIARERNEDGSFVTDRGTLDAAAFYPDLLSPIGTTVETEYRRYTAVVQLGSSAKLGEFYFPPDRIRTESIDRVLELEENTHRLWSAHPAYYFVEAQVDYEAKYRNFEMLLTKIVSGI